MYVGIGPNQRPEIWLQDLDALEPREFPGLDVQKRFDGAAWAPDSRSILVVVDQRLRRIDLDGGAVRTIGEFTDNVVGISWHADGTILIGTTKGVMQMPAAGGTATLVTRTDAGRKDAAHTLPEFLPDGRRFLYSAGPAGARAIYVGSLDLPPEQQSTTPVLKTEFGATFALVPGEPADQGRLLFVQDGTLFAQRFDASRQALAGEPAPLAEQVLTNAGNVVGFAFYSVSEQGTLIYRSGVAPGRVRQLTWFDRGGVQTGSLPELARYNALKLSPDGTRALTSRTELQTGNNADLWVTDVAQQTSTRLTFGEGANVQPVWSADGRHVAWVRTTREGASIYRKAADGSGSEERLFAVEGGTPNVTDWSPDGRFLIYALNRDVWALPVGPDSDESRKPVPVVQGPRSDFGAYVSPDGRWVAYISDETGRQELYVQPFRPGQAVATSDSIGGKWMVSRGTRGFARWRADGRELLFIGADRALMAVDLASTPTTFKASAPRELFQLPEAFLAMSPNPGTVADVTRDHQRLLLLMPSETRQELLAVVNWHEGVR
jgi:eukaryotic-like serine/threonine-protein kinase